MFTSSVIFTVNSRTVVLGQSLRPRGACKQRECRVYSQEYGAIGQGLSTNGGDPPTFVTLKCYLITHILKRLFTVTLNSGQPLYSGRVMRPENCFYST